MKNYSPLPLTEAFNDLSQCPARRFEVVNNMAGIAGHYKIPYGLTAKAYEDMVWDEKTAAAKRAGSENLWDAYKCKKDVQSLVRRRWAEMLALNPVLEKVVIKDDSVAELAMAHIGATSSFNVDDINFFLELHREGKSPARDSYLIPGHGERLARINAALKEPKGWVCAPATAQKIENCLIERGLIAPAFATAVTTAQARFEYMQEMFYGVSFAGTSGPVMRYPVSTITP